MTGNRKQMGRLTKIAIWIASFFLLYTVFGFFAAPALFQSILTQRLTERLHRDVSIGRIYLNPYSLTVRISGFSMKDRSKPDVFVSFDEFFANLQAVSLFKRALVLSEFRLTAPFLNLVRTGERAFNFSDLLEREEAPSGGSSRPFRFSVSNIRITGGRIHFSDEPKQASHRVDELTLSLPFVSNFPYHVEAHVEPLFRTVVNGTPFSLQGRSRPFHETLETVMSIEIEDLDLTRYLGYVPFDLAYRIESGLIDIRMEAAYEQAGESAGSLYVSGKVAFRQFKATEKTGELLNEIRRVDVSVGRSDLFSGKLHIEQLAVSSPRVNAVRNAAGEINLAKLMVATGGRDLTQKAPEQGFILTVDEIRLSDGRIDIRDETVDEPFTAILEKIDLKVLGFTNDAGRQSLVTLSLLTDAGEDVALDGSFTLNPLSAQGNVSVKKVPLKRYAPYYRNEVLFQMEAGDLDMQADCRFVRKDEQGNPQIQLSGLSTRLSGLRLRKDPEKEAFFETSVILVSDTSIDVTGRRVTVGKLSTEKGGLRLIRSAEGVINLTELVPGGDRAAPPTQGPSGARWEFLLKEGTVSGYQVAFNDAAPPAPVSLAITGIDLKLEDMANRENSTGAITIALNVPGKGRFALAGDMGIHPPVADLRVTVTDLDIRPYQPYWKDKVNATVAGGAVSTKGDVTFRMPSGKDWSAGFKGEVQVADFHVIDNAHHKDFLKWRSLGVKGLDLSLNPTRVRIDGVTLSDVYSRISIDENGRVNLQDIAVSPQPERDAAASRPATDQADEGDRRPPNLDIRTVRVEGGKIDYSDRFIRPRVNAELSRLEGTVTGLTSEDAEHADVHIKGKVNQYAPLEITGKINPLGRDLYLDLKFRTSGIDLSPATPYAGKYMGYTIEKGKLSLQLDYRVSERRLNAENRVFLDQFTLGQKVEHPEATQLPVALAVSLLKNRAGEIKLDLPVTGSLDDPQFKVGKVILQMVVNLLQKVLTAPFALLGALAGGGEELSYVEFEPGSSEIDEAGREKLGKLVDVLYDRPGLRIELKGHADPETDREALRQKAFMRKLKEQKMKVLMARGEGGKSPDDIDIGPEEYETYLEMAYRAEKGPLPGKEPAERPKEATKAPAKDASSKADVGAVQESTPEGMKKALMEPIRVPEDQLRLLALKRAERTRDFLLASGKAEAHRVFLSEPKSLSPEKEEAQKNSRVDFTLK